MSEDRLYPNLSLDTMVAGLELESPAMPEPPTPLPEEYPEDEEDDSPPEHPLLTKIKSKIINEIQAEQLEIIKAIEPKYDNKRTYRIVRLRSEGYESNKYCIENLLKT